jgi:hypothetical protein
VEGAVEDRNVRDSGQCVARLVDRGEGRGVVQRRQLRQRVELAPNRIVDHHRLPETRTAVNDPVRDRVDRRSVSERRDRLCGVVLLDHRELHARRARVDDEDLR